MDCQMSFLIVLSGLVCSSLWVSGSVLDVRVKPGDNITVYCDCPLSTGVYAVWYRNCSHLNQPSLVLKIQGEKYQLNTNVLRWMRPLPRFQFVNNISSKSYDLLISNITESDEGLYFCGTETTEVVEEKFIAQKPIYAYGNAKTRILMKPNPDFKPDECGVCWVLLFSLCPAFALLSSLLCVFMVYLVCRRKDTNREDSSGPSGQNEDGDVCYAALEIRQTSQRPKKRTTDNSDLCAYSAVKPSRESTK